ncbi:MAG: ACP S-malonyltransferase [Pseudomonadota bacterium]
MKAVVFPGQGSQFKGMGRELFTRYHDTMRQADAVLGYSLAELCLEDPRGELDRTEFTQPAIYIASFLGYRRAVENGLTPNVLAGHSVGEYAALTAANVFDLETGLAIVRERARLMGEIMGGGLAAVVNQSQDAVHALIEASGIKGLEIANVNSPMQVVIGAPRDKLRQFVSYCNGLKIRAMPLRVSGPFHTSLMRPASEKFRRFLDGVKFRHPETPVIANLTAEPHDVSRMADTLAGHIASPVQWTATIERMLDDGVKDFVEIGERQVLTPLIADIRTRYANRPYIARPTVNKPSEASRPNAYQAAAKGAEAFCKSFGCERPLVACALGNGASGPELVGALARSGTLAFLDTDGVEPATIEISLAALSSDPALKGHFGVSITCNPDQPESADHVAALLGRHDVRHLELRGFDEPPSFIEAFRRTSSDGGRNSRIIARVANADAADNFLKSSNEDPHANPVVDALCVDLMGWRAFEAPALSLLFHVLGRRNVASKASRVFVGVGGMAGSPQAVQALWAMGIDFVTAGSILLTSREAALPEATRAALRKASYDSFRLMPDWTHPEFGSRSWTFATEPSSAVRMDKLQSWYLAPTPSTGVLAQILGDDRDLPAELHSLRALIADEALTPRELRQRLRVAAAATRRTSAHLECDGSLAQWNAWLSGSPHAGGGELAASRIVTLLHP